MIRIFLTGYMGAGKTTLGKAFARKMNIPFIDLDWYIEERFHKTVGELFTVGAWRKFAATIPESFPDRREKLPEAL